MKAEEGRGPTGPTGESGGVSGFSGPTGYSTYARVMLERSGKVRYGDDEYFLLPGDTLNINLPDDELHIERRTGNYGYSLRNMTFVQKGPMTTWHERMEKWEGLPWFFRIFVPKPKSPFDLQPKTMTK